MLSLSKVFATRNGSTGGENHDRSLQEVLQVRGRRSDRGPEPPDLPQAWVRVQEGRTASGRERSPDSGGQGGHLRQGQDRDRSHRTDQRPRRRPAQVGAREGPGSSVI